MPELPEVETVRRSLEKLLLNRRIESIQIRNSKLLRGQSPKWVVQVLTRACISQIQRRAKYLLLTVKPHVLLIHLGMSGQVFVKQERAQKCAEFSSLPDKHTHVVLQLEHGWKMFFRDPRRFGRFQVLTLSARDALLSRFGPEPLEKQFTLEGFKAKLFGRKTSIKALLLNQTVVAGIGNIYADESLFLAGIYPETLGGAITSAQSLKLHQAIQLVLKKAIKAGGTSISDFFDPEHQPGKFQQALKVYGREGEACFHCGQLILKKQVAQRGTHWCPKCQLEKNGIEPGKN